MVDEVSKRAINRVESDKAEWQVSTSYPEELQRVVRWKTLVGGTGSDWVGGIPQKDVIVGLLDLDPGGYYPAHSHLAPEIYLILSGTADWTIGDDTFTAKPGMAIYHAANTSHRMVNRGTEALRTAWFWWAPDGCADVLTAPVQFLEPT
jgi:quercetin dioxygenase-like cupin family protein